MENELLLIVDMQTGYPTPIHEPTILNIQKLLPYFSSKAALLYENAVGSPVSREFDWNYLMTGTSSILEPFKNVPVFKKFGYSGFTEELENYLKSERITSVYIVGVYTEACVLATAFSLFDAGYTVKLIENCCWSPRGELHKAAIAVAESAFRARCTIADIINRELR